MHFLFLSIFGTTSSSLFLHSRHIAQCMLQTRRARCQLICRSTVKSPNPSSESPEQQRPDIAPQSGPLAQHGSQTIRRNNMHSTHSRIVFLAECNPPSSLPSATSERIHLLTLLSVCRGIIRGTTYTKKHIDFLGDRTFHPDLLSVRGRISVESARPRGLPERSFAGCGSCLALK